MRRRTDHPGQIGDFWLSKRPGSDCWYRTWYDARTRQTRRASLDRPGIDASDFRQAQIELAAYVLEAHRPKHAAPERVLLSVVLAAYYSDHGGSIPSEDIAQRQVKRFNAMWPAQTVAQITEDEQDRYVKERRGAGAGDSTIDRELSVLRAAFQRAERKKEITSAPFVKYLQNQEDKRSADPKGRPLSMDEMAALFNAAKTPRTRLYLL